MLVQFWHVAGLLGNLVLEPQLGLLTYQMATMGALLIISTRAVSVWNSLWRVR